MLPLMPMEPEMDLNHAYAQQQMLVIDNADAAGSAPCDATALAFDAFASSIRTFQQRRGAAVGFGRVSRIADAAPRKAG